jgi:hypothetical protein
MSRLPVLKPREVIRALERLGFVEVRQPIDGDLALPLTERRLDSPGGIPLEVRL